MTGIQVFDSLESVLLTALGAFLFWLFGMLKEKVQTSTKKRRAEVDKVAALELRLQKKREVIYILRNQMLQSGHFKREDLPPLE